MESFGDQLTKFKDKTITRLDNVVYKIVFDFGRRFVEKSPVGDWKWWKGRMISPGVYAGYDGPPNGYVGGHFRANWQHGIATAPGNEIDGTRNDFLSRLNQTLPTHSAGLVHYIVNNTPYAQRIEDGWSWHQQPNGIVGVTVMEFNNIVNKAISETR
jgi:hypothetical protein